MRARFCSKKANGAEGEQSFAPFYFQAALLGPKIVLLGSLSDDLRGLGHHAEGDRSKHGAGSDEGEKLGHVSLVSD